MKHYSRSELRSMPLNELEALQVDVINEREANPEAIDEKSVALDELYCDIDAEIDSRMD